MSVTTPHAGYVEAAPVWQTLRDAYAGPSAVKAARAGTPRQGQLPGTLYLPCPAGMRRPEQYAGYRDRAVFLGATKRATDGIVAAIGRHEPTVEAPGVLTPQLEDVTQTGVPLRTFAEQAARETLLMGRFGVLVDFPPLPVAEDATMPLAALRPYWVAYHTEEILNWRTLQRHGDTVLSLVVLHETRAEPQGAWPDPDFFVDLPREQYRVLRLNEHGQYEVSVWVETVAMRASTPPEFALHDLWIPTRNGVPLDFIPFVFMAPFSLEPAVETSLMEPLVEVNFQYYRHSADYEHGLHMTALPTPYVCATQLDPQTELLIGSTIAWVIPDSTATVGMLEFNGQGLQSHEHALEADLKNMAALGARLLEGQALVQETATALKMRHQSGDSPLQSLTTTVSQGLTQALQVHAWWAGVTDDPDDTAIQMTLNKDFVSTPLDPQSAKVLMEMLLNNTISYETWYWNLQRGELARPLIPVEEEQALLEIVAMSQPLAPAPPQPQQQQQPPRQSQNGIPEPVG